jgi:hypothetical protein
VGDTAEPNERFGWALAAGDFDFDEFADLAIGVPEEDIPSAYQAGAVNVLYGTANGLKAARNQVWTEDSPGVPGLGADAGSFGGTLASGDFDGDFRDDLAVGAYKDTVDGVKFCGAVDVIYGGGAGLTVAGAQRWTQKTDGVAGVIEETDYFGLALSAGDFDGDGRSELAIGVPFETISGYELAGAVEVLAGGPLGLTALGSQLWWRGSAGIVGSAEFHGAFGRDLGSR